MRQTQITKLEMMPVSLPVSRHVDEIATRRSSKLLDKSAARRERSFESDRACEWSIVEENCERPPRSVRMTEEIRLGSVNDALPLIGRVVVVALVLFFLFGK